MARLDQHCLCPALLALLALLAQLATFSPIFGAMIAFKRFHKWFHVCKYGCPLQIFCSGLLGSVPSHLTPVTALDWLVLAKSRVAWVLARSTNQIKH